MRKTKEQKAITLIALIITIVVLLILAVVAINAVTGDGIIQQATNAKADYKKAQEEEEHLLQGYLQHLDKNVPGGAISINEAQKDSMLNKKMNSRTYDEFGNKIVIPAGFKITEDTNKVTEGIVIEDVQGNQFVWVPVGKIYYNEKEYKTITLGRYENFKPGENGEYTPIQKAENYATNVIIGEYCTEDISSSRGNYSAKGLENFCKNTLENGGYYIARYEAGITGYNTENIATSNGSKEVNWTGYTAAQGNELKLVSKAGQQVWNNVTQNKASELSRNMYKDATTYTSDLINSYAWDTAIIFIQTFGNGEEDNFYYNQNRYSKLRNYRRKW